MGDILTPKIVKPKDFVNTANLATVIAVIPNDEEEKFLSIYNEITEYVVPNSATKFISKNKKEFLSGELSSTRDF